MTTGPLIPKIKRELRAWLECILAALPYSVLGNYCRRIYWGRIFNIPGNAIIIFPGVRFLCTENLQIGTGVSINFNGFIDPCQGAISIGNNVAIGPNCVLRAADHRFEDPHKLIKDQGYNSGVITIEDDVWLGGNVVILKDVTVGKGSVIGAGAVVTKDIPPFSIAVGVPARVIGRRGLPE